MARYRIIKTFMTKPEEWDFKHGTWPPNPTAWVAQLDDSDTLWEFSGSNASASAVTKKDELQSADVNRKYKIEELPE
tara:strand:- start:2842 stop:3072 length:231 start_codon:yes stop_codon:yes gene_type:complete